MRQSLCEKSAQTAPGGRGSFVEPWGFIEVRRTATTGSGQRRSFTRTHQRGGTEVPRANPKLTHGLNCPRAAAARLGALHGRTIFAMERRLKDLRGIGAKMLGDFEKLGIRSVDELKSRDAQKLYDRICKLSGTRQDPCVLDTYRCAIEQARNPELPREQTNWWYWSRVRKKRLI